MVFQFASPMTKTLTISNLKMKGVCFSLDVTVPHGGTSGEELKTGTWSQKPKQRTQRRSC